MSNTVGIISWGFYLPKYRIKGEEITKAWGKRPGFKEKTVLGFDEDVITMGVAAAKRTLKNSALNPSQIKALYIASSSFPYNEKTAASTIATAIGLEGDISVGEFAGSANAGSSAVIACLNFVQSNPGLYGIVVITDSPCGLPGDVQGESFAAGAAAFIIGSPAAFKITGSAMKVTEVFGERFRADGEKFIDDLELRAYAETKFRSLIKSAIATVLNKVNITPSQFKYVLFPVVDQKKALSLAKQNGFQDTQVPETLLAGKYGDTGVALPFLELVNSLPGLSKGDKVLLISYGSGAAATAMVLECDRDNSAETGIPEMNVIYLDYVSYLKMRRLIGIK